MLKKFKPAKCKTALNLSKSRIKLLKNKKENQLKQLRREVAQLLESGQDQTARIRVEHVVREEKTLAAFELIQIYCELVVARLPIIESQKNCPLDLKEAITSLIFAAPRCGDIPELQDVRKHFIAKYGKEFVTAAAELRPDCGVSRNMIEKLSVKAPDGPTKVKILTAIAQEHNIKWEPNWFKDEDPMPSVERPQQQHTDKPGMIQMEPLNFEIADNIQQPQASQSSSHSHSPATISGNDVPPSSTTRPDARPPGSYSDRMARNDYETGRPSWTMEFKDATAAAQAAAESAERASMAARAAAELSRHSNFVNNTYSGSLPSSRQDRNEANNVFSDTSSNTQNLRTQTVPSASSGHDRNEGKKVISNTSFDNQRSPEIQVDQVGRYEQGNATTGTDARNLKENSPNSRVQDGSRNKYYRESEDSINPLYQEVRPSRDSEHEYDAFELRKNQKYENVQHDDFSLHEEAAKMENQNGIFEDRSSAFGDDYGVFSNLTERNKENYSNDEYYGSSSRQETANYDDWNADTTYDSGTYDSEVDREDKDGILDSVDQKYGLNSSENIFSNIDHKTDEMDSIEETGTKTKIRAVFDDSGSDDEPIFDFRETPYDVPSPVRSSPEHSAVNEENHSSFSSLSHNNTLDISESFRGSSLFAKLSEPVPLRFDSGGESSEDEKPIHREILVSDDNRSHTNPNVSEIEESRSVFTQDLYTDQPSYELPISLEESRGNDRPESENETQSSPESGMELNFGLFPTGRRNRRLLDTPPYRKQTVIDASSSPKSFRASVDKAPDFHESSSGAGSTKISVKPRTEKGSKTMKDPTGYFYSKDSSDSDDDIPEEQTTTRTLLDAGFSRRTKVSATLDHDVPHSISRTPGFVRKIQTQTSSSQVRPKTKASEDAYSSPSPTVEKQITPKKQNEIPRASISSEKAPSREDSTVQTRTSSSWVKLKTKVSENVDSAPSPTIEKQMTPKKETEISRASSSSEKAPSRENSTKKPDHVHPKLPDFETLTAHMLSLKTNRQN